MDLQEQYDKIYSFFKTTTEPFDDLNWDGKDLIIILADEIIEKYSKNDLIKIIPRFNKNR